MTAKSSALLALALVAGCRSSPKEGVSERRAYAQLTKESTLVDLGRERPTSRAEMDRAAGWAVFGDGGAQGLGMKEGVGFGVAHDTKTGAETYLRMHRPEDAGPPCRVVLVFAGEKAFRDFVAYGGKFDGQPPAGVEVYQFFADGLAPSPEIVGTSFVRDKELDAGK